MTYQSIFCLILVKGTHSGPIEISKDGQSWRIEFIFTWDNPKKVRKTFLSEHWMSICISKLEKVKNEVDVYFLYVEKCTTLYKRTTAILQSGEV